MFSEVYETLEQQPAAVTITPTLKSSIFSLGVHGRCRKKRDLLEARVSSKAIIGSDI